MYLRNNDLRAWLTPTRALHGGYRHLRLSEVSSSRHEGIEALAAAVTAAHEDAKRHLAEVLGETLDPFGEPTVATEYPAGVHTLTLQGYLGEILAGVVAENYAPHGYSWEVPAFLFRFSNAAIEGLDRRLQLGSDAARTPGRTGDDCVAFLRDDEGRIVAWLNCEAKCSADHSAGLISEGHSQLSRQLVRPVSTYQLLEVIADSGDTDADRWIAALRVFRAEAVAEDPPVRADLLLYACGRPPASRESWIATDRPHAAYAGGRPLEAAEVHLSEFDDLLVTVYPGHAISRA